MFQIRRVFWLALLPAALCGHAQAATTGNVPMQVTATVVTSCIVVPVPLVFTSVDPTADADASTTIAVTCTGGTAYNVAIDQGSHGSSVTAREMTSATTTDSLAYSLYRDTSRTLNWGTTSGTDTLAGTGTGLAQTIPVYGRVTSGQSAAAGVYTDSVNVIVNY
ncbi:Csu type fimbrial protein [Solimonas marina]|uniref:Spore coat protein U domain-containing protein n=1 Tax=Solimonas marina TaxID=2714601 RepID=A0A969WBD9_9GAMM|nr:spore coat U domain-containing protein [Solimonas marina]NKF21765.1 spore coat protein U domain-containing protein [Solimonas marina]